MAEHLQEKSESIEALKSVEGLKGPERQASAETAEQLEAKQSQQLESARQKLEKAPEPTPKAEQEAAPRHHPTKLDKDLSYQDTMRSLQRHFGPAARTFSKVIHAPVVEKASEVIGATVARPSVTLGATSAALIIGLFLYITARAYGFSLSGSEVLLSLVVGGIFGLIAEGIGKLFKRT